MKNISYEHLMHYFWLQKYTSFKGKERHVVGRLNCPLVEYIMDTKNITNCFKVIMDSGETVIDYGCGIGRFLSLLTSNFNNYIGIDFFNKLPEGYEFYNVDQFLEKDFKVDAVFTSVVLQHITNDDYLFDLLKKFDSCLKPSGCIYMNEQVGDGNILYRRKFPYINRRKRDWYLYAFSVLGYSLEKEIPRNNHTIFKFRKRKYVFKK